ncbi:MAG TPA: methyltransferase domain-containing protein [Bacteroidota bacterium]|nr:methyltransferase domain-containing protein [Bacteroidota bacterium]
MLQVDSFRQKDRVRAYFDWNEGWRGGLYDRPTDRFAKAVVRRKEYIFALLNRIPFENGSVAVDVGCGAGIYLEELARGGFRTCGVDHSQGMVDVCRKRLEERGHADVEVLCADIEHLPFAPESADLALSIGVLGYLVDDVKALQELHRILKPGGYLVVNVENMFSLANLDYLIRERFLSLARKGKKRSHDVGDSTSMISSWVLENSPTHHLYRLFHTGSFRRKIEDIGFRHVDSLTFGFEFRLLRRSRLSNVIDLDKLEVTLERILRTYKIPVLSSLGESYTGLFQKVR